MNPAPTGAVTVCIHAPVTRSRTSRVTASSGRGSIGISWAVILSVVPDRLNRTPAIGPILRSGYASSPAPTALTWLNQYVAPGFGKPEETSERPPLTVAGSTPDSTASGELPKLAE